MVVKHQMEHICSSTSGKVTSMTSQSWVADKAVAMLKKDPTVVAVKILKDLQDEHHVTLNYHTVWKGKQKAATGLYGSWEESFRMLYNYKAEIELRSSGSIVEIDTTTHEGEVHFSKLFIAFKPCIDGFVNGCRPYISIDSTHLNGKWNGQLAIVTALDGHNWMFPVAYGFIESENGDNWAWFMNQVKKAIGDPPVLVVCTDACKGLENAVKKVFPQAEQRECFRHMWHNFQKYFHGDVFGRLWPAARAYRPEEYQHHMAKVFDASEKVYPYLRDYHNLLWMWCMFNPAIKCDYINNNLAECFNAWVRDIKDLPIVQLADKIREMIMELFRKRRMIGERFTGIILPFVIHQLNAKTRGLGHLKAKASADWSGEVKNAYKEDERHVVKTLTHECTCLQWQHTGKPCDHALAFINVLQARNFVNMEDYVHEYYSVSRFRAAYEGVIEPLTDKNQWPHVDTGFVLRPPIPIGKKKGAGRTRKQRIKSWWEGGSRKGSLNKCRKCGEVGHREAGCPQNGTNKRYIVVLVAVFYL
uniref:SWIM-type domain-containing protein n=1 Tax=Aegilops tauschii subsp. strangulata TaxID=200361 RepID=A0A453EDQ5_AEGTS